MTTLASTNGAVAHSEPADRQQMSTLLGAFDRILRSAPALPSRVVLQCGELSLDIAWTAPPASATDAAAAAPAAGAGTAPAAPAATEDDRPRISAPLVGTFYRCPEPDAPPFVEIGDVVAPGQNVAIIEAMKLMNTISAEVPGRVVDILVADGGPVEYGQPLFVLEPVEPDEGG
jgi:acetyl-CoA carboxylase biotin carboxyl carrier protein